LFSEWFLVDPVMFIVLFVPFCGYSLLASVPGPYSSCYRLAERHRLARTASQETHESGNVRSLRRPRRRAANPGRAAAQPGSRVGARAFAHHPDKPVGPAGGPWSVGLLAKAARHARL